MSNNASDTNKNPFVPMNPVTPQQTPQQMADDANSMWVPTALTNYDAATADIKNEIATNKGLDSVSKQELMDQLAAGRNTLANTRTSNMYTYGDIQVDALNKVAQQERTDMGDGLTYRSRRLVQDQQDALRDAPGRNQTVLTARDVTPSGAPTLLTAAPGGN